MQTFGPARELVEDPDFARARAEVVGRLVLTDIDGPIRDLIADIARLPHCFTLQSCHGHFVCRAGDEADHADPIPIDHRGRVRYRIAYVALCLEASERGRGLRAELARVPGIAPDLVQFGSPDWFWQQHVNSYALQVEPSAWQYDDEAQLEVGEARQVERARDLFFGRLRALVDAERRAR